MRAYDLEKDICIIEGGEIGGAGVMWSALASKTMWELAKDYDVAAKRNRGYSSQGLIVDYQAVWDTVIQAVKEKQYQMLSQTKTYSPQTSQTPGSTPLKRGWGSFISGESVTVKTPEGSEEIIHADYFLICPGSKPKNFPDIDIDQEGFLNSGSKDFRYACRRPTSINDPNVYRADNGSTKRH